MNGFGLIKIKLIAMKMQRANRSKPRSSLFPENKQMRSYQEHASLHPWTRENGERKMTVTIRLHPSVSATNRNISCTMVHWIPPWLLHHAHLQNRKLCAHEEHFCKFSEIYYPSLCFFLWKLLSSRAQRKMQASNTSIREVVRQRDREFNSSLIDTVSWRITWAPSEPVLEQNKQKPNTASWNKADCCTMHHL